MKLELAQRFLGLLPQVAGATLSVQYDESMVSLYATLAKGRRVSVHWETEAFIVEGILNPDDFTTKPISSTKIFFSGVDEALEIILSVIKAQ